MVQRVLTGLSLLTIASSASAAQPIYFHKPGVDRDTFAAEFSECVELARGVKAPAAIGVYSPNMYAQAANAFLNGFFQGSEKRRLIDNVLRTCMADKGYRRIRANSDATKRLRDMTENERIERLFGLATAPDAKGEVLPR